MLLSITCLSPQSCLSCFNLPLWIAFMWPRPEPYLSMVLFLALLHRQSAARTSYRPKRKYRLLAITPRDHCATVLLYISGIDDHPSPESGVSRKPADLADRRPSRASFVRVRNYAPDCNRDSSAH